MAASLWIGLSLDEYFFDLNSLWAKDDNEQGVNRKTILSYTAHTWRTQRLHHATLASRTNYY